LEPPQQIDDIFVRHFTGSGVKLLEDRRMAQGGNNGRSSTWRVDLACAGMRKIYSGLVRWEVCCAGRCFAIGIISDKRYQDFKKDKSMDWPFVRAGFGSGIGLIKSDNSLTVSRESYISSQWSYGSTYGQCAYEDCKCDWISDANTFAVVLDMDRGRVSFEADGVSIPGSCIEGIDTGSPYRFITSLPDRQSTIEILHE
jgi:hypothetical protein